MFVVQQEALSAVLSEFARTVITDFPIQAILDHLVERIVAVLPVTAAGVTLMSETEAPHYVAASNPSAMTYEDLQSRLEEGPCRLAFRSGEAVCIPDLARDERFPTFGPAAVAAGLAATFSFPLRHGHGRLGALDLYCDVCGPLTERDVAAAQTLADVTAAYLLNARAREDAREVTQRFQHSAMHDPLTGLPNRLLLHERLEHAAQRAQRSRTNAAVLFADLDQFKLVNDAHGHQVGDELLLAVARRLATLVRPGDTLARVSGDEFVFLCEDLHAPADVEVLARRIDEAMSRPFRLGDIEIPVRASVGMAYAGPGEDISAELVAKADAAMYEAKRRSGGVHGREIYDLRDRPAVGDEGLAHDLRVAFAGRHLEVWYQPIVRSGDERLTGVEALLRWTHPQRGAVDPSTMVAVAEATGLIQEIGGWVLERACDDRAAWLRTCPDRSLDLWVNVSGYQLSDRAFAAMVDGVLRRTGTRPEDLVLEVTETVFIADREAAISALADLARRGIRLALDDFGTGFSSLSALHRLPIDIVKIDQEFVADVDQTTTGRAIVNLVAEMAHLLELTVVAEGVESANQHAEVRAAGTDLAQGFYYGRPVPASRIAAMLAGSRVGAAAVPAGPVG